jgi:hypothetical protein
VVTEGSQEGFLLMDDSRVAGSIPARGAKVSWPQDHHTCTDIFVLCSSSVDELSGFFPPWEPRDHRITFISGLAHGEGPLLFAALAQLVEQLGA